MAVPGRRNDDDDNFEEDNALFEEEGLEMLEEPDIPPHLRDLASAAEFGDVEALRRALGPTSRFHFTFLTFFLLRLFVIF